MSSGSVSIEAPASRSLGGIACVVVGMMFFVVQDALMKLLLGDFTIWMLILARSAIAVLVLVPLILYLGAPHRLLSPLWPLHLTRAALFAFGFALFYAAFPFMGLAEVTTIFFSAPLLTALIAAIFLGEKIGVHRTASLGVGFAGVVIAMNPTGDTFQWVAILPLITAATYAASQVIARRVGDRETSLTLGLYTIALAGVLLLPASYALNEALVLGPEFRHLRWDWSLPGDNLWIVPVIGVVGMIGYILISRAYQIADAGIVAPFDYTYLPLAALMAYALWDETPEWTTIAGMVLIIGSGLYLGYRELMQTRRVLEPTPTAEIVFTPGAPIGAIAHTSDASDDNPTGR
ncbi:MAG: DMT family transporter [Pseudomonadota bacterium]